MKQLIVHFIQIKRSVYLDYNATTPVSKAVRTRMNTVLKYHFGNASAIYNIGIKSADIIYEARKNIADTINAKPEEIILTSCATESNNTILKGLSAFFKPEKNKIISTPIEHPSMINTLEYMKTQGVQVEYCPVDKNGMVILSELEKRIDEKTFLVSVMLANNEIGTIQDLKTISKIVKSSDILLMSDCVQALGKIPVDVQNLGIDYATFSAHKLYGPKGVGALYVRSGSPFVPLVHGGHQEDERRAGTESIHNIAGFGEACRQVPALLLKSNKMQEKKYWFIKKLEHIYPDCIINSPKKDCLPNTISVTFPGINNAGLLALLNHHGISVSAGSACSTSKNKPSHVLKAIGLSDGEAWQSIRFSFGSRTTQKSLRYTLKTLNKIIAGNSLSIDIVTPSQLDENKIFDDNTFILDVRPDFLRKRDKSLPKSHEISFFSLKKFLKKLPKDKHIIVVCQRGNLSFIVTCYLQSKGFNNVSSLWAGVLGWKEQYGELYEKHAGQNIIFTQTT